MSQRNRVADNDGITTSIKPLGNGKFGVRVYRNSKVIQEDNTTTTKKEAATKLKELLRWVDKLGYDSETASASRDRFYCGDKADRR